MTILTQVYQNTVTRKSTTSNPEETFLVECGRLLQAAVMNRRFRDSLLADPVRAIESGYCGEKFSFTREEKLRIRAIQASSLEDFAAQISQINHMTVLPEFAYMRK